MSQPNNELENYLAAKMQEIDPTARKTRGSGSHGEIGDVQSKDFYIEAKIKGTKINIIMDYHKEFIKLQNQLPLNTLKEMFVVIQNKLGKRFVVIESEAFFRILKKGYKNGL